MDYPRWIDNPLSWHSPYDGPEQDHPDRPTPVRWIDGGNGDKQLAVISGVMDLRRHDIIDNVRQIYQDRDGRLHEDVRVNIPQRRPWWQLSTPSLKIQDTLNGYNPGEPNHGVARLMEYLSSMSSQLREILSINAVYRNHFPMVIKQMYHGTLHQEAKITRHYAQMSDPCIARYIEHQQRGIAEIQRHGFLKEHAEFERMLMKTIDGNNDGRKLMDVFRCRTANYIIIDQLLKVLSVEMKKMNDACYAMPNHPSCQIIRRKATLNTERLILHIAFINYEDEDFFKHCYKKIYRCKCFM